ncbi:hypothetical protein GNF53_12385 [Clostridium perfringens]|uniref:hypothetical protein n=1 Tax=Clostridium perfringens TaxID=1502 RepID=UPI002AC446A6|nr:hypothetical protein [Clostridium perfringens]MDZ5148779.1 hypothetical protein [Clostridium perfringens]
MSIIISKCLIDDLIEQIEFIMKKVEGLKESTYIKESLKKARKYICSREYDKAELLLKNALIINSSSAEIENLLGVIEEKRGNVLLAERYYRAALAFEPCYLPADNNLKRTVFYNSGISKFDLG